jgi:hypothetical protein
MSVLGRTEQLSAEGDNEDGDIILSLIGAENGVDECIGRPHCTNEIVAFERFR